MTIKILGFKAKPSTTYQDRYECFFYGWQGIQIRDWIQSTFGHSDDLVYMSDLGIGATAFITEQQLHLTLLRWA